MFVQIFKLDLPENENLMNNCSNFFNFCNFYLEIMKC